MFFDTHTHYDDARFDDDRFALLAGMKAQNVSLILNAGADMPSSLTSVELSEKFDFIYAAVGVHPHDAKEMTDNDFMILESLFKNPKVVAVGEIGLDYHYDFSPREIQKEVFKKQLGLATKLNKPVIIHNRESTEDCIAIVKEHNVKGVFHCFSGSLETAKELFAMGYYLSFGGVITFANAKKFIDIIKWIPDDKILIETDCPYLAPVPYRGQRNHSGFIVKVAEKVAEIKGWSLEKTAEITLNNGKTLFNIERTL